MQKREINWIKRVGIVIALLLAQLSVANAAENDVLYDVYALSASAQSEVKNDLMTVNLVVQAEGSDASEVADSINGTMGWAVVRLKPYSTIKTETRDYRTNPKYAGKPRRIVGWYATQMLQLESDDFEAMTAAIQKLQERLQVQGMHLSAKRSTRQKAEDALITEAMNAFKQRALLVQQNMGAPGYRVININIGTSDHSRGYPQMQMRMEAASDSLSNAPAIEAGTSMVNVRIDGSIQLEQ
jgi:predicted secreted protein